MGFLAPIFLFALAAVAAPLYLHLLRRQTTTPRPFASLMFFEPRTQASMRHRRLRYLWLLALRLALVALLVLAFAGLYILRPAASLAGSRLTLFVVDDSFSMQARDGGRSRLAAAQAAAEAAAAALAGRGQAAALGASLDLLTRPTADRAALRAALAGIEPGYAHADFAALARGLRLLAQTTPTPIQVEFYSDLKRTSLPPGFADLALPANVRLRVHAVGAAMPNWTVSALHVPAQLWGSPRETPPARIQAVVSGYGTPAATRHVTLELNGRAVAEQNVAVPASGSATVDFDSVVVPYGWSRVVVKLDGGDGFPADDAAYASIVRTDPERILLVRSAGDNRSTLYFTAALTAGEENGGAGAFTVNPVSAGASADQRPGDYALVVLDDVPSLPAAFDAALQKYAAAGGGVFIAAGLAARAVPFFDLEGTHNYGERALTVAMSDASHPATALLGSWPGVRFFYSTTVNPAGARVLARLSDQTPLLLDKAVGEGHVMLFASGLDNLTNDFPLHPGFVPFIRQTAHYLAGDQGDAGGSRLVGTFLTLRAPGGHAVGGVGLQVTDPGGGHPFSLAQAASASALPLAEQGFYQVQLANGREQVAAVNPDRRESDLSVIPAETLALWQGVAPAAGTASQTGPGAAAAQRVPSDLWWYIMLVLLVVTVAESVVAARYLGVSRSEESVPEEVAQ